MTEKEAIEVIKSNMPTSGYYMLRKALDTAISALEEIQQYREIGTVEECREAVEKQKPKKVIIEPWSPALCPTCRVRLSESLGDGYYKHWTLLQRCTRCEQVLDWSGEE